MTEELLRSATDALRLSSGATDGDGGGGGATLARVLHTVRRRKRVKRLVTAGIVQVMLLALAAGAWAVSSGRLSAIFRRPWVQLIAGRAAPPPRSTAVLAVKPVVMPLPVPAPVPAVAPESPPPPAPIAGARPPATRVGREAAPARAEDLYRRAHEAHFGSGDFATALSMWDRYLASTPLPRFAVEARFNRAIALLRLGRLRQAAAGLRPFADGDYGSYRRDEARRLLSAIESGAIEAR